MLVGELPVNIIHSFGFGNWDAWNEMAAIKSDMRLTHARTCAELAVLYHLNFV